MRIAYPSLTIPKNPYPSRTGLLAPLSNRPTGLLGVLNRFSTQYRITSYSETYTVS